ncbi:hypothetical protein MUG91_G15n156 [Manis pentadactyla]|nr:hypothetical protein MUG91_G15n156 [Manis pentadactyla]
MSLANKADNPAVSVTFLFAVAAPNHGKWFPWKETPRKHTGVHQRIEKSLVSKAQAYSRIQLCSKGFKDPGDKNHLNQRLVFTRLPKEHVLSERWCKKGYCPSA